MKQGKTWNVWEFMTPNEAFELPFFVDSIPWQDDEEYNMKALTHQTIKVPSHMAENADFVLRSPDDSMSLDDIKENRYLICQRLSIYEDDDDVYIVNHHQHGTYCRRLVLSLDKTNYILKASNQDYETLCFPVESVHILGKVLRVCFDLKRKV